MMYQRIAALGGAAAAVAALAAAPAVAQAAPAITTTATCVGGVATAGKVPFVATGFTPGANVTVSAGGQFVASGTADATGTLRGVGSPPIFDSNVRHQKFSLTATDGTLTAPAKVVFVTHVGVRIPTHAKPRQTVRYRAYGWVPGRRVYIFIRRHGQTLGRVSLGKAKGPCGDVTKRLHFLPLKHFTTGTYTYYVSLSRRFSKRTAFRLGTVTIFRTFH